jgi:hypothetical protein
MTTILPRKLVRPIQRHRSYDLGAEPGMRNRNVGNIFSNAHIDNRRGSLPFRSGSKVQRVICGFSSQAPELAIVEHDSRIWVLGLYA